MQQFFNFHSKASVEMRIICKKSFPDIMQKCTSKMRSPKNLNFDALIYARQERIRASNFIKEVVFCIKYSIEYGGMPKIFAIQLFVKKSTKYIDHAIELFY